jgi:diacylglycerol kinase family enzyme
MRVTLVHNAAAGDDSTPDAEALVRIITDAGHTVHYQSARDEHWSVALDEPADLVVAAGGDGTVGRVARRMVGRGRPMTAISLGTANNIARSLGLTGIPVEDQVAGWRTARPAALDAGQAEGVWGRRFFIEGLGIGLFASLMAEGDRKRHRGPQGAQKTVASAVHALGDYLSRQRAKRIQATLDGADISGEYLLFAVMNMQFVGPNLYLAPNGHPADRLFDIVMVRRADRQVLSASLAEWETGHLVPPHLPTMQGRVLVVGAGRHAVHIDDWLTPLDPRTADPTQAQIRVEVHAGALEFLLPDAAARRFGFPTRTSERDLHTMATDGVGS